MPEETQGVFGEAAPAHSPEPTTEPGAQEGQQPSTDGQGTQPTGEGQQHVPYDRFKEVNENYRSTQAELKAANARLAEYDRLAGRTPEEKPQFETAEDLIKYQDKSVDEKLSARDRALESRFEAERKMSALEKAYPEEMQDPNFTEMIANKIRSNPKLDLMQAAKQVKEYFGQIEERGRKKAEEDFLKKGNFGGGVVGNQPLQKTDADKEYVDSIVNAGGNKSNGVF